MDLSAYIYTINKNRSFPLSQDEIKDLIQETRIYLLKKDYNDELTRLTIRSMYIKAIKKKITQANAIEKAFIEHIATESENETEIHENRAKRLQSLNISPIQKKILDLLIKGFSYKEVRKKLRISDKQLRNHVQNIKTKNPG